MVVVDPRRTAIADVLLLLGTCFVVSEQATRETEALAVPDLAERRSAGTPVCGDAAHVVLAVETPAARGHAAVGVHDGGVVERVAGDRPDMLVRYHALVGVPVPPEHPAA